MKIACLQLNCKLGEPTVNIASAERNLLHIEPGEIDYLVLPELAFSGYNFPSLSAITPFLEPTAAGTSTIWARATAQRLRCIVTVGYPEIATGSGPSPTFRKPVNSSSVPLPHSEAGADGSKDDSSLKNSEGMVDESATGKCYNSAVTISPTGEVLAHYRKTFLYYTDETWATEGDCFGIGNLSLSLTRRSKWTVPLTGHQQHQQRDVTTTKRTSSHNGTSASDSIDSHSHSYQQNRNQDDEDLIPRLRTATGICMDINPHKFTAPWDAYEFAHHCLSHSADLIVLSMAWLSHALGETPASTDGAIGMQPDLQTLGYWVERFRPVVEMEGREVVLVCANRCGWERGACYAGSSCVMRVGKGKVEIWGLLGRAEDGLLVVDTEERPGLEMVVQRKEKDDGVGDNEAME